MLIGATAHLSVVVCEQAEYCEGPIIKATSPSPACSLQASVQGLRSECNVLAFDVPAVLNAPVV